MCVCVCVCVCVLRGRKMLFVTEILPCVPSFFTKFFFTSFVFFVSCKSIALCFRTFSLNFAQCRDIIVSFCQASSCVLFSPETEVSALQVNRVVYVHLYNCLHTFQSHYHCCLPTTFHMFKRTTRCRLYPVPNHGLL